MRKKAFGPLEIVFTILISSYIIYEMMYAWQTSKWNDALNKFNSDIYKIIDKGILNNVTGYLNGSGGDCSISPHYNNISAARVVDCNDWSNTFNYKGTKNNNGKDSYITGLLKNYSVNDGCSLYIDDKDTVSFYVFIDCSNLTFRNSNRSKQLLEEYTTSSLKNSFSTIYQGLDRNSISIDSDTGGTDSDGMLRFLIKK